MNFNYNSDNMDVGDILHSAQIITNAFSKVLEENNCVLMLSIGLHQEIDNSIKDLEDLVENVSDTNDILDQNSEETKVEDILDSITEITNNLKEKCFKCDLKLPDIDFNINFDYILGQLKAQIQLYKDMFKIDKIDLCQPAFSLQDACVPDILRLITLLLTAFVSIMTLKKLSNISINAFIKGVLSTLLSKITQSLKITVNIGSTNISCLIDMLKEIALAVPTQDNINSRLAMQEKLALGIVDEEGNDTGKNPFKNEALDGLSDTLTTSAANLDKIEGELNQIEDQINESFELVNTVIDSSLEEVNNYLESLLSFQTFFECEINRSGMEVEEAIQLINNLIQVINMLSSLVLSLVKKEMREDACRTKSSIDNISESEIEDLFIKDIISENSQSMVDIIKSSDKALSLVIHDKPLTNSLPKLDLLDCSIDDFVESHTLPRIIAVAKSQLDNEKRRTTSDNPITYVFNKPSRTQTETISNIVDLIYKDFNKDPEIKEENPFVPPITNPIGKKGISNVLENTIRDNKTTSKLACKSVEDVLSILNDIRR